VTALRACALVLFAIAPTAAGCGSSSNSGGGKAAPAAGGAGSSLAVSESEFKLTPANPSVARPGTVRITVRNAGQTTHALEVKGPGGEVKSPAIAPGQSKTIRVDLGKAGRYQWYCPIDGHRAQGMQGQIVVAGGGSSKPKDSGGSKSGNGYGAGY
jgi:uncharacterized cupredoxin-like copper-binding protein